MIVLIRRPGPRWGFGAEGVSRMDDPEPQPRGEDLAQVLARAGATRTSVIRVLGPNALAALIWLCRHGYDNAGYCRPGFHSGTESGDVLLIPSTCTPDDIEQLLADSAPLREGGLLILQTAAERAPDGSDPVHPLLERLGYRVERCVHRGSRELHLARRAGHAPMRAAA